MKSRYTPYVVGLLTIFVLLFGARLLGLSVPVTVTTSTVSSELSVVGEGKVDVVPDTAYVDIGVAVQNVATAQEAQKQIADRNNALVAAMKELGVKEEDIKTSNFSVNPNYVYDGSRQSINGYIGNVLITVKAPEIALAEKIVEKAAATGANQIQGTRFVVDAPEKYREQARDKAIANAKDQAQKLASSLGITLGRVTNIVEASSSMPPILYSEKAVGNMGGDGRVTPDFQAGTQTITSTVTLYFEKR